MIRTALVTLLLSTATVLCSCTTRSSESTVAQRQDAMLKNPYGAGLNAEQIARASTQKNVDNYDEHDISGGGTWNLDKAGMKHDLRKLWEP